MKFLARKKALLGILEATYGVDPVPTGAANAILVSEFECTPLEADEERRNLVRPYLGSEGSIPTNVRSTTTFTVELAGAGAAGDVPAFGVLLRGCGMAETITATTSVAYEPVSEGFESLTLYANFDGQLHRLTGARGTVSFTLPGKGLPKARYTFTGMWQPAEAAALPTADYSVFQMPRVLSKAATPTADLWGAATVLHSLEIDLGNEVISRDLPGDQSVEIVDRQSKGRITIDLPALATLDPWAAARDGTTGALSLVHGTVAGHIVELALPKVQLTQPKRGSADGISTLEASLDIQPTDAGDDEIVLTIR